DPYAKAYPVVPEVEKEVENKGKYITPEVYGRSAEEQIGYIKEFGKPSVPTPVPTPVSTPIPSKP
ncbi:MAG TPA: hypothetical protein VEC36_04045, partial [Patescibacteria group bacterium]|nr:hypothetical protein [Patescibacteria group bacterium]